MSVPLPCPVDGCPFTEEFVNELAAHLIATHDYERADAVTAAKKVQSRVDPFGLEKNGIKTHVEPAVTPAVTPPAIEETAMPKTPKPCKVCARLAPKKCKRHGGTGGGSRPPAAAEPAVRNGHDPEIAKAIVALNARIQKLTEARDALEAL